MLFTFQIPAACAMNRDPSELNVPFTSDNSFSMFKLKVVLCAIVTSNFVVKSTDEFTSHNIILDVFRAIWAMMSGCTELHLRFINNEERDHLIKKRSCRYVVDILLYVLIIFKKVGCLYK